MLFSQFTEFINKKHEKCSSINLFLRKTYLRLNLVEHVG